jgi:hypothetical protein
MHFRFLLVALLTASYLSGCLRSEIYKPVKEIGFSEHLDSIEFQQDLDPALNVTHNFPVMARLKASKDDTRIYLRIRPSQEADDKGYGLPGDIVSLLNIERGEEDSFWYYVEFRNSGAEGWIPMNYTEVLNATETEVVQEGLCGDLLPEEYALYPVNIFPLYFKEKNSFRLSSEEGIRTMELLQNEICDKVRFGFIRTEEDGRRGNSDIIIVGHFLGETRVEDAFVEISERLEDLGLSESLKVEVGNPITLDGKPSSPTDVVRKSGLSSENLESLRNVHRNGEFNVDFDIVLPTYIPNGYKLQSIEVEMK